jgi:hypothetical protein
MSGNLRDAGTTSMFAAAARANILRRSFQHEPFRIAEAARACKATHGAMRTWLSKHDGRLVERLGGGLYRVRA